VFDLNAWQRCSILQIARNAFESDMFLIQHTNREQLLYIVEHNKPGEPFDLDSIMESEEPNEITQI
jgi:hypothetical protein